MARKKTRAEVLELRRQHANSTRSGRKVKSTTKKTLKAKETFGQFLKRKFASIVVGQVVREKYNPIPANLRPWVPHRRRMLAQGSIPELAQYAKELRAVCTKAQWKAMEPHFWRLI
jgi:hypothetical protein